MSIFIEKEKCVSCGQCVEVCPGNLIRLDENGKAKIRHPKDCWGCTSCLKECRVGAAQFYLSPDIGGMGSRLTTREEGDIRYWMVERWDGTTQEIAVNKKDSNQY